MNKAIAYLVVYFGAVAAFSASIVIFWSLFMKQAKNDGGRFQAAWHDANHQEVFAWIFGIVAFSFLVTLIIQSAVNEENGTNARNRTVEVKRQRLERIKQIAHDNELPE